MRGWHWYSLRPKEHDKPLVLIHHVLSSMSALPTELRWASQKDCTTGIKPGALIILRYQALPLSYTGYLLYNWNPSHWYTNSGWSWWEGRKREDGKKGKARDPAKPQFAIGRPDFLIFWLRIRMLLLRRNPYENALTSELLKCPKNHMPKVVL